MDEYDKTDNQPRFPLGIINPNDFRAEVTRIIAYKSAAAAAENGARHGRGTTENGQTLTVEYTALSAVGFSDNCFHPDKTKVWEGPKEDFEYLPDFKLDL